MLGDDAELHLQTDGHRSLVELTHGGPGVTPADDGPGGGARLGDVRAPDHTARHRPPGAARPGARRARPRTPRAARPRGGEAPGRRSARPPRRRACLALERGPAGERADGRGHPLGDERVPGAIARAQRSCSSRPELRGPPRAAGRRRGAGRRDGRRAVVEAARRAHRRRRPGARRRRCRPAARRPAVRTAPRRARGAAGPGRGPRGSSSSRTPGAASAIRRTRWARRAGSSSQKTSSSSRSGGRPSSAVSRSSSASLRARIAVRCWPREANAARSRPSSSEREVVAVRADERRAVPDLLLGGLAPAGAPGRRAAVSPGGRGALRGVARASSAPLLGGDLRVGRGEGLGRAPRAAAGARSRTAAPGLEQRRVPDAQLVAAVACSSRIAPQEARCAGPGRARRSPGRAA